MKYTYIEKITLTKDEVSILDEARRLLEEIYEEAKKGGDIETLSREATEDICDLLSDDYSDME